MSHKSEMRCVDNPLAICDMIKLLCRNSPRD
jgi:hypothetical protein